MTEAESQPLYALRERLIRDTATKGRRRPANIEMAAWAIRTWNAMQRHEQITRFVYRKGLDTFPRPI